MAWKDLLQSGTSMLGTIAGGSVGGPFGALVGGGLGSLLGGLGGRPFDNSGRPNDSQYGYNLPQYAPQQFRDYLSMQLPGGGQALQLPQFGPQQSDLISQLGQMGLQGIKNIPQADFSRIREAAKKRFEEETVPSIAERFSALGSGGQRSGAFAQQLGSAGAGLEKELAGMEETFKRQGRAQDISQMLSLLQMGMTPRTQTYFNPPQQSGLQALAGSTIPSLIQRSPEIIESLSSLMKYLK
ncbi:MAG: hypothetical protein ACOC80_15145 [Petrotogales bacterium]